MSTSSQTLGGPRRRRTALRLAAALGLALVAIAAAALIPGSHSTPPSFGVQRTAAGPATREPRPDAVTQVAGSSIPASRYGRLDGLQENQGVDAQGQLTSDLAPLPPASFDAPIARYRAYAERWSARLARSLTPLTSDLRSGSRAAAQRAWATSLSDWLHLGAVYGLLPTGLQRRLAGIPPSLGDRRFAGLHRLERGLWTGQAPRSLVPVAGSLARAVAQLRRQLPTVTITPLDYATRAHEILEDAQRDLMSGTQVPWSGAGVLGTVAATAATREVITTLVPVLQGRDNTLVEVQNWLVLLQRSLNSVRRGDGTWPSVADLSQTQRERLDGNLAGALGALSGVPGTLETKPVAQIPTIASQSVKP
ncbi:MAG: EfeM/EfeO family lipoprotein [Solirubrobacteraceae bacterium]